MDLQQEHRSYTVFVPSNEALSNMKAEALDYLLSAEVQSFYNTNLSQVVDIYICRYIADAYIHCPVFI